VDSSSTDDDSRLQGALPQRTLLADRSPTSHRTSFLGLLVDEMALPVASTVLSPRGSRRLGFSLGIRATGSCSSAQKPAFDSRPLYAGRPSCGGELAAELRFGSCPLCINSVGDDRVASGDPFNLFGRNARTRRARRRCLPPPTRVGWSRKLWRDARLTLRSLRRPATRARRQLQVS
jgi:hypothetical protein